jgi:hypothetical protein
MPLLPVSNTLIGTMFDSVLNSVFCVSTKDAVDCPCAAALFSPASFCAN